MGLIIKDTTSTPTITTLVHTSMESFTKKGVNAYGTVRVNRKGFPKDHIHTRNDVERGYYDYRSNGPLLETVWFDKKFIYFQPCTPLNQVMVLK